MKPPDRPVSPATRRKWISQIVDFIDRNLGENIGTFEVQIVGRWVFLEGILKHNESRTRLREFFNDAEEFQLARFDVDIHEENMNPMNQA